MAKALPIKFWFRQWDGMVALGLGLVVDFEDKCILKEWIRSEFHNNNNNNVIIEVITACKARK